MTDPRPDPLLYGHDPTERIVGLHLLPPDAGRERMRVYSRLADDTVAHDDEAFFPFFFVSDAELLRGLARESFQAQRLEGDGFYRWVVAFASRDTYLRAVRFVEERAGAAWPRPLYAAGSFEQQYLLQSGRTLFKGMTPDHLHRMQVDIEVRASGDAFPDAGRDGDSVIVVAMSDNRGWRHVAHAAARSERDVLAETVDVIRGRDPDVLEGHNCLGFDFPYLLARCRRHGVPFAIGRDGSVPRTFPASMRFAERTLEFPALEVAGRHVIDTMHLVMGVDVHRRDLPGYGLKVAARHFGLATADRTYLPGDRIGRIWDEDPERVLAYALDDVLETQRLAERLHGSAFYLTQMVPVPYGHGARLGPAAKIESLFVREYLRRRHALPAPQTGTQEAGGYTDIFLTGVVGPIVYADVESLYPSVMLRYDVQPQGDALRVFPELLAQLTALRLSTKAAGRAATDAASRAEMDARQAAFKIVINSFYGMLGFSRALFNDHAEADRVTSIGRQILRDAIAAIRQRGGTVVEADTDGVLFIPPDHVRGEDAERAFVGEVGTTLPAGITLAFDGRFRAMLSYKKKNYALEHYDGRIVFKGSSLVSRAIERFGREFVRQAVGALLAHDVAGLHQLYLQTRAMIVEHRWPDGARSFQRTETLRETAGQYLADVAAGRRQRGAAYEVALRAAERTGRPAARGDRVAYYVTGSHADAAVFEHARLAKEWDPAAPDENTAFYLRRLDEFAARFEPFFASEQHFRQVFSEEDLFGFDPAGVELVVRPAGAA